MAIKIKKNGKIENFILHSTDVRVLDLDGKFKSKNLEDVLREVSDTEHVYIGEVDEEKDGIWIDDKEILDNEEDNGVVKRLEEYVDKKVDVVNSQMNDIENNKLDKTAYISKSTSLTLLNNWVIETGTAEVCREGKLVGIRANIKGGTTTDSTIVTVLPEEYRPKEICMLPFISCDATYTYTIGYLMIYTNGQVVIGGSAKNTRVIINATFNL